MSTSSTPKRVFTIAAWLIMLFVSDLPDMLITWMGGTVPGWLFWGKAIFLFVMLLMVFLWGRLRLLWQYIVALLVLFIALGLTNLLRGSDWFQDNFNYQGVSYFKGYAAIMSLDILVAMAVLLALWLMLRDRKRFFLVRGEYDAPIEPIRWLGIKAGGSWKLFGWIFGVAAALAVAIPTILVIQPTAQTLLRALPLLPFALLFAAVNAFTEEAYFRASLLSTLHPVLGKTHTLLLMLVFFGLAHWLYGSPPGITGFLMTGFLAWVMGRAMFETKGFLWPWIIHFLPDAVIFFSYALLFVQD